MSHIRNYDALARTPARADALRLIDAAYDAIETEKALRTRVRLDGEKLFVGDHVFLLSDFEHVYIVGCGKIACQAAVTLEEILKNRVRDGAVIGIAKHVCEVVSTYEGSHPMPSVQNFDASDHMMRIGASVTHKDLVLAIIGGGGSALLCSSQQECDESARLYQDFLKTGGTINELNVVRKHLSPLKGGGLAKVMYPATVVGLIFSDVSDGELAVVASGPTYMDDSTVEDARAIIEKYRLGSYNLHETIKDPRFFEKVHNIPIVTNAMALEAMKSAAERMGYAVIQPACDPYPTPESLFACVTAAARPKSVVVYSGEVRFLVPQHSGSGGRNTTLALGALKHVADNQVFASFASDGRDNSAFAGAVVDRSSAQVLTSAGVVIDDHIARFDANPALQKSDDLIDTGPVEANVADIVLLLTV